MNYLINILSKIAIIILFYFAWQNIEGISNINQNLIYFYLIMVILTLFVDKFFFKGKKTEHKKTHRPLSTIISISWFSALIVPLIEYPYLLRSHNYITIIGIITVFIGVIIRGLSIRYLGQYFSRDIETWSEHNLIDDGLYNFIRHPAYLGNMIQIIGFPLILNAYYSLILSAIVIICFLKRIELEEGFLEANLEGYAEYEKKSYRLIPFVW
ncbi:MAG: isoprenylcysteine carboxylmethyltransferase family protein [Halanaerobiales bacterium]